MTVVKVQRPIVSTVPGQDFMVYDQHRARVCFLNEKDLPKEVLIVFASAPEGVGKYKQHFDDAEWSQSDQRWDLSKCKPVTRRLTW